MIIVEIAGTPFAPITPKSDISHRINIIGPIGGGVQVRGVFTIQLLDALNALSFFDYLRDVILTGRRQVFFATANGKLTTLFERKFDFLGAEKFRRFNLKREARGNR